MNNNNNNNNNNNRGEEKNHNRLLSRLEKIVSLPVLPCAELPAK